MAESPTHSRAKRAAAGRSGDTEVALPDGRRLDARTRIKATEVERSGDPAKLEQAAKRLKASRKPQKVLQVPQRDFPKAVSAMKKAGVGGTVKNMSGTKSRHVPKKK